MGVLLVDGETPGRTRGDRVTGFGGQLHQIVLDDEAVQPGGEELAVGPDHGLDRALRRTGDLFL